MMQPERQSQTDPLDPAHFAIASYVVAKLQMIANAKQQEMQQQPNLTVLHQDNTLVDRFGNPLHQDPVIEGEFREVGRGQ